MLTMTIRFGREPWGVTGTGFLQVECLSCHSTKQCQSNKENANHWPQPVVWTHSFLHPSQNSCSLYAGPLTPCPNKRTVEYNVSSIVTSQMPCPWPAHVSQWSTKSGAMCNAAWRTSEPGSKLGPGVSAFHQRIISNNSYAHDKQGVIPG